MPDFASLFALLLLPVALILFMTRNFGRKIRHPHQLVAEGGGPRIARFFFRSLRSRYDLLFDATLALVLALALRDLGSPLVAGEKGKAAFVLDCSRSMFAGAPGSRPVDAALSALSTRPTLAKAERFALVYDPTARKSRLLSWSSLGATGSLESSAARAELAARLLAASTLYAVDYRVLQELPRRGFRRITLATDAFPYEARGFELLETGFAGPRRGLAGEEGLAGSRSVDELAPAAYPSSLFYDRSKGAWSLSFVEAGRRTDLSVESLNPSTGAFAALPLSAYGLEEGREGRKLSLPLSGLLRFRFRDPAGGIALGFVARLGSPELASFAAGNFSELVRQALPFLALRPRPSLALVDAGREEEARKRGALHLLVTGLGGSTPYLADPGLVGGRPLAAGYRKGLDFSWDAASLANRDLPLVYDEAVARLAAPPFLTVFPPEGRVQAQPGGAWLVDEGGSPLAVNAPATEYFEPAKEGLLEIRKEPRELLWALLLGGLAFGKLLVWHLLGSVAKLSGHTQSS